MIFASQGEGAPPVSTTLANLPPVSMIPAANNGNNIRLQTVSSELKKPKIYLYANSTTQRCPKEIMKTVLNEDFFPLSCEYLREFSKNRNGLNCIIRGLGETDPSKKSEIENLVALSL
jgi:hypothetical protein